MKILKVILFLLFGLSFSQCEECDCVEPVPTEYGKVNVNFILMNKNIPVTLQSKFAFAGMQEFMIEKFAFYMANIQANNGGSFKTLSTVEIINFEDAQRLSYEYSIPVGDYTSIRFDAGLDEAQNASDPAGYEIDHPLSSAQGLYWSWAMKYKFSTLEGRANENMAIGDPSDVIMSYHPGHNDFHQSYNYPINFIVAKDAPVNIDVYVDIDVLYNTGTGGVIDIPTENQTHTTPSDFNLAQKFQTNLGEAISMQIQ